MTLLKSEISKVKKRNICCRNISVRVHLPCQILGRYVQWRRNDYQVVGGGRGAATRKLPTPKFKFLLGFRSLHFENAFFKRK